MDEAVSGDRSETNRLKREGLSSVLILLYFNMRQAGQAAGGMGKKLITRLER
jgi:hypothetical protein